MRTNDKFPRPDVVSDRFPDGTIKLFTKLFPPTQDNPAPRLLIEGDATSLEYLGRMILAQAAYPKDCGYGISPKAAGRALFHKKAEVAISIHRLPCLDPTSNSKRPTIREKTDPPKSKRKQSGRERRRNNSRPS